MFGLSLYARVAVAAIIAAILAMSHWKVYVMGKHTVESEWNKAKAVQAEELAAKEKQYRQQEQDLVAAKNNAEVRYEQIKSKTRVAVAGARAELDRLRNDLAAGLPGTGAPAAAGTGADAAAVRGELFGDCATRYPGLAEEAGSIRDKLIGLQDYVASVCQKQADLPKP